ncbi:hypothetical protein [Nocardia xishanensis]|uniref:hypothetical protein n=1 Tax=Nocardia xishanensis TaxID=238964 RepID=UPI001FDFF2AD|nr:hypothetical protein [Nocardia xishanensis]
MFVFLALAAPSAETAIPAPVVAHSGAFSAIAEVAATAPAVAHGKTTVNGNMSNGVRRCLPGAGIVAASDAVFPGICSLFTRPVSIQHKPSMMR